LGHERVESFHERQQGLDGIGHGVDAVDGVEQVLAVDNIIVCAGQEPDATLAEGLRAAGIAFDVIGGARFASELDALRAIDEGTRLAYKM
jgi:2,4-dienoyl-CoA reductase (NADPH2)